MNYNLFKKVNEQKAQLLSIRRIKCRSILIDVPYEMLRWVWLLAVIGLECDTKWANGYVPLRNSKCLKCLGYTLDVQTTLISGTQEEISPGLFEKGCGLLSEKEYYYGSSKENYSFFFHQPLLSASSEKKVKPKSITFDKQCLVWLPYLSLCRAL